MTKDNASGAGMELPELAKWLLAETNHWAGRRAKKRDEIVAALADQARDSADKHTEAQNAKLEAQVERFRERIEFIAEHSRDLLIANVARAALKD